MSQPASVQLHNYSLLDGIMFLFSVAGAAGLNLMVANYCFLMDPAMNSAVEEQAIDR